MQKSEFPPSQNSVLTPEELCAALSNASPLALPGLLCEAEFYDREEAKNIIDRVYAEFAAKDRSLEDMALAVVGGFVEGALHPLRKGGVLAKDIGVSGDQIVKEIRAYHLLLQSKVDEFAANEVAGKRDDAKAPGDKWKADGYQRQKTVDARAMKDYRQRRFSEKKTVKDDYGNNRNLRATQAAAKGDRRIKQENWARYSAEVDHRVPLKEIDARMKAFGYCDSETTKRIANQDANFAITDKSTNTSKGAKSARDAQPSNATMQQKDGEARAAIRNDALVAGASTVGLGQTGKLALAIIVPIGGEILDIILRGLQGVGMAAMNAAECISTRMARVAKYAFERLKDVASNLVTEVLKMLTRLVISMMVKAVTGTVMLICKGIGFVIEGLRLVCCPGNMTTAQRWQAFIGLVGGTLVALLIDIPGSDDNIINGLIKAILAGIISAFLMFLLNKLDLFSDVAERRLARINEIFDQRIRSIRDSAAVFDIAASQRLQQDRLRFDSLRKVIGAALEANDYGAVNDALDDVTQFFDVDVPYATAEDFVIMLRSGTQMNIGPLAQVP